MKRLGMINGLGVAGLAAAWLAPFLSVAPNRLVAGAAMGLPAAGTVWAGLLTCGLAVLTLWPRQRAAWPCAAIGVALIWAVLLAAGHGATVRLAHATPATRVGLGAGVFLLVAVAALMVMEALRLMRAGIGMRTVVGLAALAGVAAIGASGALGNLSLLREYGTHRVAFHAALARHVLLVALTLAGALALGVPLGLAAWRRPRLRPAMFGVLNVVQTVPSVALFGLLMAPLAAAGLSGIGLVPAVIALVFYALLPTVRGLVAGLDGVAAAPLEAATGMGMSPAQVFARIHVPLAAPALLAALRVVVVQAVGLAVVAALIGAGGLGDFVFQGLGQYAVDLVLLGALPATLLALLADALISAAASLMQARAA
jgi:osmoprotectant transport system permease protein